jgi:hypothetical protein
MPNFSKTIWLIVLVSLSLVVTGIFVYQWWQTKKTDLLSNEQTEQLPANLDGSQIYKNIEFGFEFQYPIDWSLHPNTFSSPFSKFNLIGSTPEEKVPNTIIPSFLVNIVTPDFATRAAISFKNLNASISPVVVAGINGTKYEYEFESTQRISIVLPFGEYFMILGAKKEYEDIFNQIITSVKFLK